MKMKVEELRKAFCGVYVLYNEGIVVYAGQSVNMYVRVQTHLSEGVKFFDEVEFIETDYASLLKKERELIELYLPMYNLTGNPSPKKKPITKKTKEVTLTYKPIKKWAPFSEIVIEKYEKVAPESEYPLSEGKILLSNNTYVRQQDQTIVRIKGREYVIPKDMDTFIMFGVSYYIPTDTFGLLRLA